MKALEIILYFQPRQWFLENPRTGFLKERWYMQNIPFIDVDYCQFSLWGYQKPTRIWGGQNVKELGSVVCDAKLCLNVTQGFPGKTPPHRQKLGGANVQFSTKQKGRIPYLLVEYLAGWKTPLQIKEALTQETQAKAQGLDFQEIQLGKFLPQGFSSLRKCPALPSPQDGMCKGGPGGGTFRKEGIETRSRANYFIDNVRVHEKSQGLATPLAQSGLVSWGLHHQDQGLAIPPVQGGTVSWEDPQPCLATPPVQGGIVSRPSLATPLGESGIVSRQGIYVVTRNALPWRRTYNEDIPFDDEEFEPPHPRPRPAPYKQSILDQNWEIYYRRSPIYKEDWGIIKGEIAGDWPTDVKVYNDKMYFREKLCVPDELLLQVVNAHHVASGHLGVDRLIDECRRRYVILDQPKLKDYCTRAKKFCTTCAQCDPPSWKKRGKITTFPIFPKVWDSLCMDIFLCQKFFMKVIDTTTSFYVSIVTQGG